MKIWLRRKAALAASTLVLFFLGTAFAQKPADNKDADTVSIKKSIDDWAAAYNRHDPNGASQGFTEDADMVSIAGILFHGRKAIEEHYGRTFTTSLQNAHRVDTLKSVRFFGPELASVDVDWEITGSTAKTAGDNSVIPLRKGILALIFVKEKGQWLVAVSHEIEFSVSSK